MYVGGKNVNWWGRF